MSSINNISANHNKDYDHAKDEPCTEGYVIDNIFNDLMKPGRKYIYQAVEKFKDFRRKSPVTYFKIHKKDFSDETRKRIEHIIRNCKTGEEAKDKLDGIMTEVIALIFKEAEPLILSNSKHQDRVLVIRAINEIRSDVSKRWEFV